MVPRGATDVTFQATDVATGQSALVNDHFIPANGQ
jgi:hypothetical protein